MNEQVLVTKSSVHDWIDYETRHVDVVASWESMCSAYDSLRFNDELSDMERLEEFKWITHNMNTFLTKVRTKLLSCEDSDAMQEVLQRALHPSGKMELPDRKTLAYHKLKQQWIMTMMSKVKMFDDNEEEI